MAIDRALIEILRCPETRQRLAPAEKELLARLEERCRSGGLRTRSGGVPAVPLDAGLVREDGQVFYPIRDGIPVLLIDESIAVPGRSPDAVTR